MATQILPGYLHTPHHFINGQAVAGTGEIQVIDPATAQVLTTTPRGTTDDVDAAVQAAHQTFRSGAWSRLSGRERSRVLYRVSELMRERTTELAEVESYDVGKPISLANAVDVNNAADTYEYAASLAQHLDGAVRRTPLPAHAFTQREPLGVVAAITPFNFPLILSSSKIAVALAAGNSVVHKPAEDTPLSALYMARLLQEAGVPDGVYNVVTGYGSDLGDHLITHPNVHKVAFTGSSTVGAHVAGKAGQALRPITAELGGNAPNIIFDDADLDQAIQTSISAFVFNTGQFCMGGPRLLVQRGVYERVIEALAAGVPHVPFGDPRQPETVFGPLATQARYDKVVAAIEEAKACGARVLTGGEPAEINGGFFYRPTVLADVENTSDAVQEEIFGPVLTVQPFDTEQEAIELANSTDYGLAAGIQTENMSRAHRVADALEAGIVWVNSWAMLDPSMPFGGVKSSGWGRENGPEQLHEYTRTKSVIIALKPAEQDQA